MTVSYLFQIAAAALTGMALLVCCCLGSPLRQTSLTEAWKWGLAAECAWFFSCTIAVCATVGSPLLDQMWLWTAILTLCPLIAALGARRPVTRVWSWFIILPLLAVLGWPGFTVMSSWPALAPLKVQAPVCVGFALVTVMGVGNYVGTRYTVPAMLAGLAVMLCLIPLTTLMTVSLQLTQFLRAAAGLLFAGGVLSAVRQGLREGSEESAFDRLWFDFRDTFGIVWSIRIQERINETAEREAWGSRLGPDGFDWKPGASPEQRQKTISRMEHTVRWHLRRFVDPVWIDERLNSPANSNQS